MLCEDCKKEEATFHYTEINNGKYTETHLCQNCAKKHNYFDKTQILYNDITNPKNQIKGFKLTNKSDTKLNNNSVRAEYLKCANCGLTFKTFKKTGKIGCAECYTNFKSELDFLLKNIHKTTQHIGKKPKRFRKKANNNELIKTLQKQLEQAISDENYEQAIIIRDKIKKLQLNENAN